MLQYPGCQEACKFHRESPQEKQVEPVIKARGEELLKIENSIAKWPRPYSVNPKSPLVYIVMRKNADSSWTQIIQTVDRSIALSHDTITTNLRVLVVNPEGLVTMYSPAIPTPVTEKIDESVVSRIMAGVNIKKNDKISINTPKSNSWALKEVSLIHQKVLVLAEVSWEPRMSHAVYLVTWEVDGGGLKGNLFTDSTCVTLSLWPDTVYHIQVEVVSKTDKSLPLVLDTHKASQVSFDIPRTSENPLMFNHFKEKKEVIIPELPKITLDDTLKSKSTEMSIKITKSLDENFKKHIYNPSITRKIFSNEKSKKDVSLEEQIDTPKSNLQSPPRISGSLSSVLLKAEESEVELIDTRQQMELILGSIAAIVLFLVICVLLVLRSKRKYVDSLVSDTNVKSQKLIEEGKTFGNGFKPIILVSEPKGNQTHSLNTVTKDISGVSWKNNLFFNELMINKLDQSDNLLTTDSFLKVAERGASEVQV